MNKGLRIHVERRDYGNEIAIFMADLDDRKPDKMAQAQPIVFEEVERISGMSPCIVQPPEFAHRMIDALWDAGFRPSKQIEEASQVVAIKYHLEDMRKLVFKGKQ